eukprot:gene10227-10387_t
MIDLLQHPSVDGARDVPLDDPTDEMDVFGQQLYPADLQPALNSPAEAAEAAFYTSGGLPHSRSMQRLQSAAETGNREPQHGASSASLPGSPRAASTSQSADPRLQSTPGSKATSTASDLLPASHYHQGSGAKVLNLLDTHSTGATTIDDGPAAQAAAVLAAGEAAAATDDAPLMEAETETEAAPAAAASAAPSPTRSSRRHTAAPVLGRVDAVIMAGRSGGQPTASGRGAGVRNSSTSQDPSPNRHQLLAGNGAIFSSGATAVGKKAKGKGSRKGGSRSGGRARCSDPETSAALAALTALANAAEGVSRFVGDHAKDLDAAAAAAAAQGGPGPNGAQQQWMGNKVVETGSLGPEEEGSRAARGPRAASKFIGVTWRERIQRWEVYVWASSSKRSHYIGAFPTSIHAARAYDVAVLWLMGQDARPRTRLNFPLSDYNLEEIQAEASAVAAMRQLGSHMTASQRGAAAAQAAQHGVDDDDGHYHEPAAAAAAASLAAEAHPATTVDEAEVAEFLNSFATVASGGGGGSLLGGSPGPDMAAHVYDLQQRDPDMDAVRNHIQHADVGAAAVGGSAGAALALHTTEVKADLSHSSSGQLLLELAAAACEGGPATD